MQIQHNSRGIICIKIRHNSLQSISIINVIRIQVKYCRIHNNLVAKFQVKNKITWTNAFANELGRLAQGVGTRIKQGKNTIAYIPESKVPKGS